MDIKTMFSEGKFITKKIIIIGKPGSGKTYLTEKLKKYFDGPVFHIDDILWENNTVPLDNEELQNKLKKIIEKDIWMIDGTYLKSLPDRFKNASLIFYLDLPSEVCIESINERRLKTDILHGCEDYDGFINYVKQYDIINKPIIEKLISEHNNKDIIRFLNRKDVEDFIFNISI